MSDTLDPRALKAARTAYQSAIPDGCWHCDGGETDAPIRAAIAAYLAVSPQPANPAQVTDACYDSVALEAARDIIKLTRRGEFDDQLKAKIQVRIIDAITVAIGAGGQAVAWEVTHGAGAELFYTRADAEAVAAEYEDGSVRPLYAHPVQPGWRK